MCRRSCNYSAFIRQCDILSESNSAQIQKALFTFAKYNVRKTGKKTNAGQIPVQNSEKLRRRIQHRGSRPSQSGRPNKRTKFQNTIACE